MSHFAKIENGIVTEVIVAEQGHIDTLEGKWVQTSYNTRANSHPNNTPLRGNFAFIGAIYDEVNDVFYDPQPYPSWTLNKATWEWVAPKSMPESMDGKFIRWDENSIDWEYIEG